MVVEPRGRHDASMPIDSAWRTPGGTFALVDTAGIRTTRRISRTSRSSSRSLRALQALGRADLACVVVDATPAASSVRRRASRWTGARGRRARCSSSTTSGTCSSRGSRRGSGSPPTRASRFPTLARLPAMPVSATERTHLGRLGSTLMQRARGASRVSVATPDAQSLARDRAATARGAEHATRSRRRASTTRPRRPSVRRPCTLFVQRAVAAVGRLPALPVPRLLRHLRTPRHAGAPHAIGRANDGARRVTRR